MFQMTWHLVMVTLRSSAISPLQKQRDSWRISVSWHLLPPLGKHQGIAYINFVATWIWLQGYNGAQQHELSRAWEGGGREAKGPPRFWNLTFSYENFKQKKVSLLSSGYKCKFTTFCPWKTSFWRPCERCLQRCAGKRANAAFLSNAYALHTAAATCLL